jgi:hypothetical protein
MRFSLIGDKLNKPLLLLIFSFLLCSCMDGSKFERELLESASSNEESQVLQKYFPNGSDDQSSLRYLKNQGFEIYQYTYDGHGKWPSEIRPYGRASDRALAQVKAPNEKSFHAQKLIHMSLLGATKIVIGLRSRDGKIYAQGGAVTSEAI